VFGQQAVGQAGETSREEDPPPGLFNGGKRNISGFRKKH